MGVPFISYTQAGSGITCKTSTRVEIIVMDKHTSLFGQGASYKEKVLKHWPHVLVL